MPHSVRAGARIWREASATGRVETLAFLGLIVMCVPMTARVSFLVERVQERPRRR